MKYVKDQQSFHKISKNYLDILTFKLRKNEIEILLFSAGLNLAYRFFFQKKVAILA